jgi:regulator of replication initiation timing
MNNLNGLFVCICLSLNTFFTFSQRLEMKLKRLKDEYINVRTDLYNRIEENNELQHELIEYRLKIDYYSQINNQAMNSIKSVSLSKISVFLCWNFLLKN